MISLDVMIHDECIDIYNIHNQVVCKERDDVILAHFESRIKHFYKTDDDPYSYQEHEA